MRRYDTFTPKAKTAFLRTVELAELSGECKFICSTTKYCLECRECPFYGELLADSCTKQEYYKTASEWLAWAAEEIEEDN